MSVVNLRQRAPAKPPVPAYAQIEQTTRAAADALLRRAGEISRMFSGNHTGGAALARLPGMVKDARLALDELAKAAPCE